MQQPPPLAARSLSTPLQQAHPSDAAGLDASLATLNLNSLYSDVNSLLKELHLEYLGRHGGPMHMQPPDSGSEQQQQQEQQQGRAQSP